MSAFEKVKPPLQQAVIIGFEENGLGVARALKSKGISCVAIAEPGKHVATKTNSCKEIIKLLSWTKESLIETMLDLGSRLNNVNPLLITKDEAVLWISEERSVLSKFYNIVLPEQQIVDMLMNKEKFTELALKKNWPVPETTFISNRDCLDRTLSQLKYPCILKPRVKNSEFRQTALKKAYKVLDQNSLIKAYELIEPYEQEAIIQEWIPGQDNQIGFCLTYCSEGGIPSVLFTGRKLRQWPIECGNTALSCRAPEQWVKPLTDLSKKIWKEVNYLGLGSIEFKMRPGTLDPVIMEPTVGRTNYQNEIAVINGFNIPVVAYYNGIGIPFDEPQMNPQTKPIKLVDGFRELRAAKVYMQVNELSISNWLRDRSGPKRYVLWRLKDPAPFFASVFKLFLERTGNIIGYIVGKKLMRRINKFYKNLIKQQNNSFKTNSK